MTGANRLFFGSVLGLEYVLVFTHINEKLIISRVSSTVTPNFGLFWSNRVVSGSGLDLKCVLVFIHIDEQNLFPKFFFCL